MKIGRNCLVLAAFALASCGGSKDDSVPTGQVVATVDGQEITLAEVKAEIGPDGADNPAAQAEALERMITRKLLAKAARDQDLDSTPVAAMLKTQAEETALAQVLARKVVEGVPKVSEDEISEFLRSFPASVTQRRLLSVEQIFVPNMPADAAEAIAKIKTLGEAEAILNSKKVVFRRTVGMIDTMTMDPGFADQLVRTEGNDIYMVPTGQSAEIGRIISSRVEAVPADQARLAARSILTRQRSVELVNNALGRVIEEGKRKVRINPQFQGKAKPVAPAEVAKQQPVNPAN